MRLRMLPGRATQNWHTGLEFWQCHPAVGEIAILVQGRFPARFARENDALTRVGDLMEKYSA